MPIVTVYLSEDEYGELALIAKRQKIPARRLIRKIVSEWIKKEALKHEQHTS